MGDLKATLERLYARVPQGVKLGLDRVEAACEKFGHPERAFEVVHVGGTNGKGSVCAFSTSMLRATGKKVGLYTSPHLCRFAERIQVDGVPIENDELVTRLNEVMDAGPDLTFFEVATIAAFLAFREAKVDVAVLEVGLGGRLDATNVVPPPVVAAITRVAFDHMVELGDSLAKIGAEKAGIIKKGTKVVLGKLHPDALEVIQRRINEVGATQVELGSPEPYAGAQLAYPRMAMFGTNLAVAATIAREMGVSPEEMANGIEATTWPGRNELLHRNGQELTLLDCAHNPDGAVTLSHVIDASLMGAVGSRRDVALVFGALKKKSWRAMLARLDHTAANHVFTAPPVAGAVDPNEMAAAVGGEVVLDVKEALARARAIVGPRGLVVVTGSSLLVGPARAILLGLEMDPPVDL
ncbi:MAG TPA: folylpolyglutamate synthase/dihydrofolate synthase family protein [Polyangiaceae bacterium]|nr:folylpolyglutamate synthase/dihydrofolate synthase family protein [Polyangiaceae bacterium]